MDKKQRQIENLGLLSRTGAFEFTDTFFPYTFGKICPYFVQSASVTADSDAYSIAVDSMRGMVRFSDFDVITGGESRDWVFSYVLANLESLPHCSLYKNGKSFGADLSGRRVLHVADLNNEGSLLRDYWVPMIRGAGGIVEDVLFYVDRREAGVRVVKDLGLRSSAVVNLDEDAWETLQVIKGSGVTPEIYDQLVQRQGDPEAWARIMLRSDAGFNAFVDYLKDSKTVAKARKVLDVGYPDMGVGLEYRLRMEGIVL